MAARGRRSQLRSMSTQPAAPVDTPQASDLTPGARIRYWRDARGLSQMKLALDIGISPRHMSFVETGRSRPSRDLVLRLANHLAIPSREENLLLESAGYARRHQESAWSDPNLDQVRSVLSFLLERHEPNSALVFDRHWDIVMSNEAHRSATDFLLGDSGAPESVRGNLLRLTFHPQGLRPYIANFDHVGPALLGRIDRELAEAPSAHQLAAVADEIRSYAPMPVGSCAPTGQELILPIHLKKGDFEVRLFSVLTTIGAAIDVTLQELRLESFFPADDASERALQALREAGA